VNISRSGASHTPRSHVPVCCVWCGQFTAPGPTCDVCGSPLTEPGQPSVNPQASVPAPHAPPAAPEVPSGSLTVDVPDRPTTRAPRTPPAPRAPRAAETASPQPATDGGVPEWQSLREAARMAGVSEESLWRCVQAGLVSTPAGVGTDEGGSVLLRTEDLRLLGLLPALTEPERFAAGGPPGPGAALPPPEPVPIPEAPRPKPRRGATHAVEPAWVVRPTAAAAKQLRRRNRLRGLGIAAAFFILVAIVDFLLGFIS
jgi:hypothetical protein